MITFPKNDDGTAKISEATMSEIAASVTAKVLEALRASPEVRFGDCLKITYQVDIGDVGGELTAVPCAETIDAPHVVLIS